MFLDINKEKSEILPPRPALFLLLPPLSVLFSFSDTHTHTHAYDDGANKTQKYVKRANLSFVLSCHHHPPQLSSAYEPPSWTGKKKQRDKERQREGERGREKVRVKVSACVSAECARFEWGLTVIMPTTNDYQVNAGFSMGAPVRNTIGDNNITMSPNSQPTAMARATPRMMGKQYSQESAVGSKGQPPLMPPVEITNAASRRKPSSTGNVSNAEASRHPPTQQTGPKQFHRRSLGDWDLLETVGAGSMGKVKLAKHHYTNEICAIKIVNRATKAFLHKEQTLPPPTTEQEVLERKKSLEKEISRDKRTIREASLGQILYHPHICRLYEMCTMSNHFYMLFEYVSGGQLLDYIIQHGSLREHHARKFARGVASALQYLHANNIVHRDLKIENIMISTSGEIKIIDFGLSNLYNPRRQLHTFCGSLYFAAPELLKANPYTGPEVDVWSFGVVLYVLVCGKVPFDDENSSVLHEKIKQGKVDYPQHLSIEVLSLLSKMLVVDPRRRATLKQVVEHHWMVRGYDRPAFSYLPNRVPIRPDMLDINVVKEMFRLEFIEDIDESFRTLLGLLNEESYLQLSKQFWSTLNSYNVENESIHDLLVRYRNNEIHFEDPTRAYHPLISIYYLVEEMLQNKLQKFKKKQEAERREHISKLDPVEQLNEDKLGAKENIGQQTHQEPQTLQEPIPIRSPMGGNDLESKDKSDDARKPLQILIPPKLVVPEQAHTSPTTRKSPDRHEDLDYVLSPNPQPNTAGYHQRSNSPMVGPESQEKSTFGGIFRKLSQRRRSNQQQEQTTHLPSEKSRMQRTHLRAFSEHVPSNSRIPSYGATPKLINNTPRKADETPQNLAVETSYSQDNSVIIASPQRSRSTKHTTELPALPVNAESILQEQRVKELANNFAGFKMPSNETSTNDESQPLPPLVVPKGRKLHPSARAKSVGHARRESLKFSRPPVPAPVNPSGLEYTNNGSTVISSVNRNSHGFLEDETFNDNNELASKQKVSAVDNNTLATQQLTDAEILEEASNAPPGSMPSIDYPRSLFLKGFFSVQTTSSKPLPIVRYKIMWVLSNMGIEFKEVKGGFICIQRNKYVKQDSEMEEVNTRVNTNAEKQDTSGNANNAGIASLNAPPIAATNHRRVLSTSSRHSSIKRQGSVKVQQQHPMIPNTPLGITSSHEGNIDQALLSPTTYKNNNGSNNAGSVNGAISEEVSTASLDFVNADDMLTTSRAQVMNCEGSEGDDAGAKENTSRRKDTPPLKFEIHIVKVRIVGLAGIHFKKVSGNTWIYKELASQILAELNL